MSCNIVSDKQILLIACIYHSNDYNFVPLDWTHMYYVEHTGETLIYQNVTRYNMCYKDKDKQESLRDFIVHGADTDYCLSLLKEYTVIEKVKLVQNYLYQISEGDNFKDTIAYNIGETCLNKLISRLDGWEQAPWGIV